MSVNGTNVVLAKDNQRYLGLTGDRSGGHGVVVVVEHRAEYLTPLDFAKLAD